MESISKGVNHLKKKIIHIYIILLFLVPLFLPIVSSEDISIDTLDKQESYTQYRSLTLEDIQEQILDSISSFIPVDMQEEYTNHIDQAFTQYYDCGLSRETTLQELFTLKERGDMWRFPLLGMLLKNLHLNFLCNMTVTMRSGWITVADTSFPSSYDIFVFRRAFVRSENVLIHSMPGNTFIEKLINWIIDRGVNRFIDPDQAGMRHITVILGSNARGVIDEPVVPLFRQGPIHDYLTTLLYSLNLRSYELETDAFVTLSL